MKRLSLRTRLIATSSGLMIAVLAAGDQSYAQDAEPALSLAANHERGYVLSSFRLNVRETHPTAPVILKIRLYKGSDAARFRALLNGTDVTSKFERINNNCMHLEVHAISRHQCFRATVCVRGLNRLIVECYPRRFHKRSGHPHLFGCWIRKLTRGLTGGERLARLVKLQASGPPQRYFGSHARVDAD